MSYYAIMYISLSEEALIYGTYVLLTTTRYVYYTHAIDTVTSTIIDQT